MIHGSSLLRFGLGFVFGYISFSQFSKPTTWLTTLPRGMTGAMPLIYLAGAVAAVLALFIIFGLLPKLAPFIGFLYFAGLVVTGTTGAVVMRDFGLAIACLSLVFIHEEHFTGKQHRIISKIFNRH